MQALMMKASGVSRTPSCDALLFERDTRDLQIGDVGILVLRHVRQIEPARLQARAGNPLDARQRFDFDGAELREIHYRHLGQRRSGRRRRAPRRVRMPFTYAFTSSCVMRPLVRCP